MKIVQYRKIFFALSAILLALSFYSIFTYGFNLGVDFLGGTLTEVSFVDERPEQAELETAIESLELGHFSIRPSGEDGYVVRTRELSLEEKATLVSALGNPTIERQNTVGPVAGAELQRKAAIAVAIVTLMIVFFVTFAFRKVSKPVSSWKYGVATIIALLHDVLIPVGIFVFLGHFYGFEIDLLFVSGLLAILGYSVHDTIVVFDRVRESLQVNQDMNRSEEFETTVGKAVSQTMTRSINTSFTLFLTLLALYFIGSEATKEFTLLLILGVIVGVYSSVCIASPLLVTFYKLQKKN